VDELAQLKLAHVPADALPRMLGHLLGQLRAASLPGAQVRRAVFYLFTMQLR
jgi:hypothetical protein